MGFDRVIGDGGCLFQIVDIAVLPEYQGKGLSKQIMEKLKAYIDTKVLKGAMYRYWRISRSFMSDSDTNIPQHTAMACTRNLTDVHSSITRLFN
ncbi:GNAT family N-acetyltransferase [Shewanella avicenniae]|uniref:GNAT family N-acetyltransferase n=1 Tax=Shewanella avicenniae TaxID=2814294 RepID=UPI001E4E93EE|nr:GNAT family N-acetyltransferase [Shewanella avicenniae]